MVTEVLFAVCEVPLTLLPTRKTNVPRHSVECTSGKEAPGKNVSTNQRFRLTDDELQLQIRGTERPAHNGRLAMSAGFECGGANQLRPAHHHHERAVVNHADFPGQSVRRNNRLLSADKCRNQQRWPGLWHGRFSGKFSYVGVRKLPAPDRSRVSSKQRI